MDFLKDIAKGLTLSDFADYRSYLGAVFKRAKELRREEGESFSYFAFAEALGLSATNGLRRVIAGQRDLLPSSARKVAQGLGLSPEDRDLLVEMVRVQSRTALRGVKTRPVRALTNKLVARESNADLRGAIEYFSRWYFPVVREVVRQLGVVRGPDDLSERIFPRLTLRDAEHALEVLQSLGIICWSEADGGFVAADGGALRVGPRAAAARASATQFHCEMLDVAAFAVEHLPEDRREINALTLALTPEGFELLRYRVRDFCREALALEARLGRPEEVVQLNIQLIELTQSHQPTKEQALRLPSRKDVP